MYGNHHACCPHCGKLIAGRQSESSAIQALERWHHDEGCHDRPDAVEYIKALATMHRKRGMDI